MTPFAKWPAVAVCAAALMLSPAARRVSAAELVVSAGPREPQDELKAFHLPPGFEAQLVAAEPDIHKPLNIAFDERGRLWITDTIEYPFPAPGNRKSQDTVKVLEDFDETGRARKITTFADDLNIPVGVLPHGDGALVYSIPNLYRFSDLRHTGRATAKEILLSTFGHNDTHGMTGSFTEGFDGWVYAVHGFANNSTIKGPDGSSITMNSGNTYRFRPDGTRVEYFTHGQVNPFGLCFDPLGNLYSSDCETKPVYTLLRGAYYPSFGKPDDGLGFGPEMCDHLYGSTAIAGICNYAADQFPAEYRDMLLVGNVVTGRINACKLSPRGSWFHADDHRDLLVSEDAWFRPVNIKLGPDGALYIADFYNRIIGHYEVDLRHPGRDKQRGRIWRIVYRGNVTVPLPARKFDLTRSSLQEIIAFLADPNLTVRMLATNYLADQIGPRAIAPLKEALTKPANSWQKAHGLWVLHRLGALDSSMLLSAAADPDRLVRTHAMRILSDMDRWQSFHHDLALKGLHDPDPLVQRCAADAIGRHPAADQVRPLLELVAIARNDSHLLHTARMALRDHLAALDFGIDAPSATWTDRDAAALADVALAVEKPGVGAFLLERLKKGDDNRDATARSLRHIARYLPPQRSDDLAPMVASRFAADPDSQLELLRSIQEGLARQAADAGPATRKWANDLIARVLAAQDEGLAGWTELPLPGTAGTWSTWTVKTRACADGENGRPFFTSSETFTGILRSQPFAVPARLHFWMAGHNGLPPATPPAKNFVRLRAVDAGQILAQALPPRNDVAQPVDWDLSAHAGRQACIEATDGDTATGYAWLAFGRFEPAVVRIPSSSLEMRRQRLRQSVELVSALKLTSQAPAVEKLLSDRSTHSEIRIASARALASLNRIAYFKVFAGVLNDASSPDTVREAAAAALEQFHSSNATTALADALRTAPQRLQLALARSLASSADGAQALLAAVADGKASPRLLLDPNLRERLSAANIGDVSGRLTQLTAKLPPADEQVQKQIDEWVARYDPSKAAPQRGAEIFTKNCAVCHRIAGQGAQIGPQLDGIGARGLARLAEDMLDPNRNVDAAFRYSTFVLKGNDVIAGLPRREEGQTIVVADSTGNEIAIPKSQIIRRVASLLSLMPGNFNEMLKPEEFNDVMSYLLSVK